MMVTLPYPFLFRTKMTELTSEISRLTREVEAASEEQGTYLAYDKRVKELAAELTLAQVGESGKGTKLNWLLNVHT